MATHVKTEENRNQTSDDYADTKYTKYIFYKQAAHPFNSVIGTNQQLE